MILIYAELNYPQFGPQDFHYPWDRRCINDFGNRHQATTYWLCDDRARLPDLDTSSPYVRGVHLTFLRELLAMGVGGFRFDAAVNIEHDYFRWLNQQLAGAGFSYGEVIGTTVAEAAAYGEFFPVTDFFYLGKMIQAFTIGGDLRTLGADPLGLGPKRRVLFVRNHDAFFNDGFFRFYEEQDARLAYAFILSRLDHHGFVYRDDLGIPEVQAGLAYRKKLGGRALESVFLDQRQVCAGCNKPELLFLRSGSKGFLIINKAASWQDLGGLRMVGLGAGCYSEQQFRFEICLDDRGIVTRWANSNVPAIGPRTALFFVANEL